MVSVPDHFLSFYFKQIELVQFLCATEVLFSVTWRQKFRPRLWYDVRLQGLYVGSAQLFELAYLWDPP